MIICFNLQSIAHKQLTWKCILLDPSLNPWDFRAEMWPTFGNWKRRKSRCWQEQKIRGFRHSLALKSAGSINLAQRYWRYCDLYGQKLASISVCIPRFNQPPLPAVLVENKQWGIDGVLQKDCFDWPSGLFCELPRLPLSSKKYSDTKLPLQVKVLALFAFHPGNFLSSACCFVQVSLRCHKGTEFLPKHSWRPCTKHFWTFHSILSNFRSFAKNFPRRPKRPTFINHFSESFATISIACRKVFWNLGAPNEQVFQFFFFDAWESLKKPVPLSIYN